jgi:predicted alpha/beta-hydrolase family hydrolase
VTSTPRELRRRHLAALRTPPLACGHRDPLACVAPYGHSSYNLTAHERLTERARLISRGWTSDEVAQRLDLRGVIAA